MEPIRVLLVDDHALFLDGLASLLGSQKDFEIVGVARDGLEALDKARETMPDVILMDVKMPRSNGLEATRAIKKEMPYVKVVMLTVYDEDETLFEAIKSGAQGYLLKNISSNDLLDSLRGMAKGEAPISKSLAGRLLAEFANMAQRERTSLVRVADLTPREKEVLQQVAQGARNRQIATALAISENTVKNHLRNILEKLHLENRGQAASFALTHGLISPPHEG